MARGLSQDQQSRPPSRNLSALRAVLPFALSYKGQLLAVGFFLTLAALSTLLMPISIRHVVNAGFTAESSGLQDRYFFQILVLASLLAVSSAGRYYFVMWLGERVVTDIRNAVFHRILGLGPSFFEKIKTGEILSRLTTDTTLIQAIAGSSVSVALRNVLLFVGSASMLVVTSPRLSAYFLVLIPLIVVPVMTFGQTVRKRSRSSQSKVAYTSAVADEVLQSIRTVQSFTMEDYELDRFKRSTEESFNVAHSRFRAQALLTAIVIFLAFSSIVAILWSGTRFVSSGTMSAGQLGQFILYAAFLAGSLSSLSEVWGDLQRASGATERIVELLTAESDITAPASPYQLESPSTGSLEFKNVNFNYPSRLDQTALKDFTLTVAPGEKLALVGPSGAGKSTVFHLLMRFYDPSSGRIMLDDVDIAELNLRDLRQQFSVVHQDPDLFSGSLLDNVRYANQGATDEEVQSAIKSSSLTAFVSDLKDGLGTKLGPKGVTVSGGQRQRIAIARAILKQAPILLLDEATSSLDSENEKFIQKALQSIAREQTTIVIAHRLSTVQRMDRIVVMDNGRIVQVGTHNELKEREGLYKHLLELQFDTDRQDRAGGSAENEIHTSALAGHPENASTYS